ncbi:MAG: hypothetical protein CMF42_05330 [Legionellales bacterium]|nr:hypothetical protein [Legionellales bacterium]OUX67103.1 MAG: hypothetical protein CBD38_03675 [bacterium TMED178]|tara:strand:- start:6806 stop:7843 length:1038 start_codon:yes stop_codon:yes gene_type:complete
MQLHQLLKKIKDPILDVSLAESTKMILQKDHLLLKSKVPLKNYAKDLKKQILQAAASQHIHIQSVEIETAVPMYQTQIPQTKIEGVKNIIAVSSGKGGVGKTTISVNLALALSALGAKVGIFDADIYGPNIPIKFGIDQKEAEVTDNDRFIPEQASNVAIMSIGLLMDQEKPMVWRGPILSNTLQQLIKQTAWPDLDYLIVDLPPGTGDTQLTISQKVPLVGAVIVTTPHDLSSHDAFKGIKMFEKVSIPVLGLIENMAYYQCACCDHREDLLFNPKSKQLKQRTDVDVFGQLPLAKELSLGIYSSNKAFSPYRAIFDQIAVQLLRQLFRMKPHPSANMPNITVI